MKDFARFSPLEPVLEPVLAAASQAGFAAVVPVWHDFMQPLLERLDARMDCRLVGSLSQAVRTIIQHRHNSCGLLLNELGGHLLSAAKAPPLPDAGRSKPAFAAKKANWRCKARACGVGSDASNC